MNELSLPPKLNYTSYISYSNNGKELPHFFSIYKNKAEWFKMHDKD